MKAEPESDVLSELLRVVRLDSALFFNAEFSEPWTVDSPPSCEVAGYLSPGARHLIIFHLITEGRGYVHLADGRPVMLEPGDIVTFPHGDAHSLGNGAKTHRIAAGDTIEHVLNRGLEIARFGGGGGDVTSVVCGFLACDPDLSKVLLGGLPALVKVNIRGDSSGQWLENSIRFSVTQASGSDAGSRAVLAKLSETLFVETIRRYIQSLPEEETGWLGGIRDPEVGRALAALHRSPQRAWSIENLAAEVGLSRSVLADRFRKYLGEGPIAYLTRWRLQLGAQLLTTSARSVAEIADSVGYESEAAFNRAFKRQYGKPPGRYRSAVKAR